MPIVSQSGALIHWHLSLSLSLSLNFQLSFAIVYILLKPTFVFNVPFISPFTPYVFLISYGLEDSILLNFQ